MRKLFCCIFLILLAYVGIGLALGLRVSEMIEKERRGIMVAVAAVKADQLRLSERQREIIGRTLGTGQTKLEEMREMLADEELNRIAILYVGKDWSVVRRDFLARVSQIHKLDSESRDKARRLRDERLALEKKVKELDNRKRSLSHQLKASRTVDDMKRRVADDEIDRQLLEARNRLKLLRASLSEGKLVGVGNAGEFDALIVKCRKETVEALKEEMSVKLKKLADEGARVSSARTVFCCFDVWPVNWLVRIIRGNGNGVQ